MRKMYQELASWWPLLSAVEDYAEEAAFFWQVLAKVGLPASPSLLELGSGGGSNAFYLKKTFAQVTLSDLSPQMLAVSRALNPGDDGDQRALRYLEWTYDPDDSDTAYTTDYVFAMREGDQPVWIEHEQHLCGLFPRAEWVRLLHETGFEPEIIRDPFGRDLFVARPLSESFLAE